MNQAKLSKEVAKLIEYHNSIMNVSYTHCSGCQVCERIQTIRNKSDGNPVDQCKDLLKKGRDLTVNDVIFLYGKDVPMKEIQKAAQIQHRDLKELLDFVGVEKLTYEEYRKPKPKERKFTLTEEEYEEMLVKGKTKTHIAKIAGVSHGTLYYHVKKWQKAKG